MRERREIRPANSYYEESGKHWKQPENYCEYDYSQNQPRVPKHKPETKQNFGFGFSAKA